MATKANERAAGREVVVGDFPPLQSLGEPAIVGDFSLTTMSTRRRWIAPEVALKPFEVWQTPTELVRDYLQSRYNFPLKIRKAGAAAVSDAALPPLMARVGEWGECAYLDVRSAYWQIVRAVSWDVDYWPNRYLCKQSDMDDFPDFLRSCKLARCALVSCSRPSSMSFWTGERLTDKATYNMLLNMRLVRLVNDVLMGVACDMRRSCSSLVYVNTDGYIVGAADLRAAQSVLADWGLEGRVKHSGETVISGVGGYRVGSYNSRRPASGISYSNLSDESYRFLRDNFSVFANQHLVV